jgi:hypothetical protein
VIASRHTKEKGSYNVTEQNSKGAQTKQEIGTALEPSLTVSVSYMKASGRRTRFTGSVARFFPMGHFILASGRVQSAMVLADSNL